MILFHAMRDGTVTTTPNFVPQGSSMQDLVMVSEFDYAYCAIKLLPASGEYIEDVPCTPILQMDYSTIFTAALPPKATVVAGSVDYQLIFTAADGTTKTTLVGSFTVPRGVPVSTPGSVEELSVKTINDLYSIMANTYGLFVGHEGELVAINKQLAKYDHLQINSLQIGANAWINSATSLHYIGTIGSYNDDETTKAFAAILSPMDAETASEAASVGLEVAYTLVAGGSIYATLSVKSRPAKDMRFAAVCFTLDNETGEPFKASCAIVGVDAYGEGETAVKKIINSMLGNVANERQYSADNPPPYPVTSVNGKTGAVSLSAAGIGADPAGTAENKTADLRGEVNNKLADYDKSTAVNSKIYTHNTSTESHADLRLELQRLADRINAALNSDDTSLDDLKEIVAYIKSNKTLIDAITTSKVNVTDIVDNLITNSSKYPLSAAQGVALKLLIDELTTTVNGKVTESQVTIAISNALQKAHESGEFDGEDGKTPVKGVDYYTDEDKAELIAELSLPTPTIVSSVDEMTDTTKHYVNQSTGTIWAYQKHEKNVEASTKPNFTNVFNPDTAEIGYRWSGSSKAPQAQDKCTLSDFIACDLSSGEHTIRIKNAQLHGTSTNAGIAYFSSNTADSQIEFINNNNLTPTEEADGVFAYKLGEKNGSMLTNYAITRFIRCVYVKKVGDSMQNATESIARNVIITIDEPITYTDVPASTEVYYEWTDTGISYAPTFKTDMIGVMSEDNVIYVSDNALPSGDYTLKASNGDVIGTYTVE